MRERHLLPPPHEISQAAARNTTQDSRRCHQYGGGRCDVPVLLEPPQKTSSVQTVGSRLAGSVTPMVGMPTTAGGESQGHGVEASAGV